MGRNPVSKMSGIRMPDDLVETLEKGTSTAILATFSEVGEPHTTLIKHIYPKGNESVLIAIHKDEVGYKDLVWQKKVTMCFVDENNVAYSVLNRAGVIRAPSYSHPIMHIVRLDIVNFKCDRSELNFIESGIISRHTSADAEYLSNALINELKDMSETI